MPITILVAIFAVIILGVGAFYYLKRGQPGPETEMVQEDGDTISDAFKKVEYKLPLALVADGVAEETTDAMLEFPSFSGEIVLWIDATWNHRTDKNYNLIINDSAGKGLYKVWIPPQYIEQGDIPLTLNGSLFEAGDYAIEIFEEGADSVSTTVAVSAFRIQE